MRIRESSDRKISIFGGTAVEQLFKKIKPYLSPYSLKSMLKRNINMVMNSILCSDGGKTSFRPRGRESARSTLSAFWRSGDEQETTQGNYYVFTSLAATSVNNTKNGKINMDNYQHHGSKRVWIRLYCR
jgi:hypothetical protein